MTLLDHHQAPRLQKAELTDDLKKLVDAAKSLYVSKLSGAVAGHHNPPAYVVAAPGRVNLIGEHTDYTGGFVMPLATEKSTVIYGTGFIRTDKGAGPTTVQVRLCSDQKPDDPVEEKKANANALVPPDESEPRSWVNYVMGAIAQYLPDLPEEGCSVDLAMAYATDIPIGAGLSSSGALAVATSVFMECFMKDMAFSSAATTPEAPTIEPKKERALRAQKAENDWAYNPCGIMDQMISSCAEAGSLMLLDCRSLEYTNVPMKKGKEQPVILVTNSKVAHEIADSEYGVRRGQCNDALEAMQQVPLYHVMSLRDANLQDVNTAKDKMDEITYQRAVHVVTENQRTKEAKTAVKVGLWDRVGELMNQSHNSLRAKYEVSCTELDLLVETAQEFDGVFGSRMTGGGFGGCTVTLVKKDQVDALVEKLSSAYKESLDKDCECFITYPGPGARVLAVDMDCKSK